MTLFLTTRLPLSTKVALHGWPRTTEDIIRPVRVLFHPSDVSCVSNIIFPLTPSNYSAVILHTPSLQICSLCHYLCSKNRETSSLGKQKHIFLIRVRKPDILTDFFASASHPRNFPDNASNYSTNHSKVFQVFINWPRYHKVLPLCWIIKKCQPAHILETYLSTL